MQLRKRNLFITIRAEGSILPADLLQRINDRDAHLKGLTPDDYHLAGGLKLNEAINQSLNRMQGAWAVFQNALVALPPTDTGTTATREKWLLPLFQELDYGRLPAAKSIEVEGKSYPISHLWQQTPIHLVGARVDLDTRTAGVAGASRISPHGLTQELLNAAEAHLWG
ncbi:MAG: type II DNA modification enzyme, partial [Acidobacteria bacterium]|nr:type II DNA modification enzyme [Acidobacteriota bacterium]